MDYKYSNIIHLFRNDSNVTEIGWTRQKIFRTQRDLNTLEAKPDGVFDFYPKGNR